MNLQTLRQLKLKAVAKLLAIAEPQMFVSGQVKDAQGQPRRIWAKSNGAGYSQAIRLEASSLAPVQAICSDGVIQNGYGNAYLRTWDNVGLEDVLCLTEVVQAEVQQAVQVVVPAIEAWTVENVNVLDRHRTMVAVQARQCHADGSGSDVAFAVRTKRAVSDLLPSLKKRTPGNLQAFLSELSTQGHEVILTQSA